jgi:hypothetical protein
MSSKFTSLPFAILFNSCKDLKPNEVLYSTFLSDRRFHIVIRDDGYAIDEYEINKSYQRKGKKVSSSWFGNRSELQTSLELNPQYYARDIITNRNSHMDKWQDFIESFKRGKFVKYEPVTKDGHARFEFVEIEKLNNQS